MKICRFCHSENLLELICYPNYPVFIGCSDNPRVEDELYDFSIYLCHDCGGIQQVDLPPLDVLYREPRFFGGGKTWQDHYCTYEQFFSSGISDGATLLEVGGGPGTMLKKMQALGRNFKLFDVEPHPLYDLPEVTTFRTFFDLNFETNLRFDAIYSSHLFEHLSDVNVFFRRARGLLKSGGSLFTACPNIAESFKELHLNAFTTDHFNYLSSAVLEGMAVRNGFKVQRYHQFRDHGMYFQFGLAEEGAVSASDLSVASGELKRQFDGYLETINRFAEWAAEQANGPLFLYGAHAFTITFLRHLPAGLQYKAVLDNEPSKQNRRLCGTDLICRAPEVLRGMDSPTVLIYMGAYTAEIVAQLKEINPSVRLLRLDSFGGRHS